MNWVLLIIWTANYVTTSEQVPFETQELCEAGKANVMTTWAPLSRSDTRVQAVCLQVKVEPKG